MLLLMQRPTEGFAADVLASGGKQTRCSAIRQKNARLGSPLTAAVSPKGKTTIGGKFPSPKLWSPEFPNLYKAVFTLYQNALPLHT
jgi:beta-galactosidase/beta-glucuronidase